MSMKRIFAGLATLILPAAAIASPTPTVAPEDLNVHSYILLDRTGSMSSLWDEALVSVNTYARSVAEAEPEEGPDTLSTDVTLAVFDNHDGFQFDVLRRGVNADTWDDVTNDEANPRGMTPLFDAIGRLVSLAETDAPEKAVLVIMTDGHENASREITRDGAKAALDRARERGWEVVFLGADFGQFGDAQGVGISSDKTMAMSAGTLSESMDRLAKKSRDYGRGEEAEIVFDEEDRAVAREDDVQK
ncbi:MAG: VWA domain-containing protein [Pseudomonadota bacterium]